MGSLTLDSLLRCGREGASGMFFPSQKRTSTDHDANNEQRNNELRAAPTGAALFNSRNLRSFMQGARCPNVRCPMLMLFVFFSLGVNVRYLASLADISWPQHSANQLALCVRLSKRRVCFLFYLFLGVLQKIVVSDRNGDSLV